MIVVLLFLPANVLAITSDQKQRIQYDATWYSPGNGCNLAGISGSGPLYGPAFPTISDPNLLDNNIKTYISHNAPGSGLMEITGDIVALGKQYNVNPALLVAVGTKETHLGTDGGIGNPPQYNFWGARGSGSSWQTFSDYKDSVESYYKNLRGGLYDKVWAKGNAATVDDIIYIASPPSENSTAAYVEFVHSAMKQMLDGQGNSATASSITTSSASACGGSIGNVSTDGYAFPVAPQTKNGNSGLSALSALPCLSTSCHHDGTPAFDIGRQPGSDASTGAAVYAISDGTVDMLHTYIDAKAGPIPGCFSLQFHSSKDNYWYWYGHIQNPRVTNGQTVTAGTQLAEIGLRKCTGNGSDPHVHIDRGCVINGVPQKGGRVECRDPGLIPLMNSLFESLPS